MYRALSVLVCVVALHAQPSTSPQPPGLETAWDIAPVLQEVSAHAGRLVPMLEKMDPNVWVEKGASETYVAQLQSARDQAGALGSEAKELAAKPERLSVALQLLFRIQGLETMLGSLGEAIRKYQSPADAQTLAALTAQNGANRERLQRYVVNLAAEREQELQVMDREAQRCRGILTQVPPKPTARKK